jgi:DNA helicase MCM9
LQDSLSKKANLHLRLDCRGFITIDSLFLVFAPYFYYLKTKAPLSHTVGKFVCFKATVIRTGKYALSYNTIGMVKMLETKRLYECGKCACHFTVPYDREAHNQVLKPTKCLGGGEVDAEVCESTKFKLVPTVAGDLPGSCKDYQEIKLQEQVNKLAVGYY